MSKIKFKNNKVEDYTIVLSNRALQHLGQISTVNSVTFNGNLNSKHEINFTVYRNEQIPDNKYPYKDIDTYRKYVWNNLIDLKIIWVKELDMYFEIRVSVEDCNDTVKTINGISLCEAELSQILLFNQEINSETDISREDYQITTFYDPENPKTSLLNRVLEKAPHYRIKHVDKSLCKLQRTFSIDNKSIYDFFVGECSEQFDCLFQFDSSDRSISVYDLMTVCEDCGERGDFTEKCPKCDGTNLKYFGTDTTIYVDKNNLTDSIHLEMDADSIKNCFKLEAGDDVTNAAVRALNPNGSDYLYVIRDEDKRDMPVELVQKLNSYDKLYNSYIEEYQGITERSYSLIDDILYYQSSMMPTIEHSKVTAQTEAEKLTVANLSPIALQKVTASTFVTTVNSALKTYAKVFVKTGYVKIEIEDDATFEYVGIDDDGWNYGTWYGRFKITNYSDETDIAYTDYLRIIVNDNYHEFVAQKIEKNIKSNDEDNENSIFDVLSIHELEDFKKALELYSLSRLRSFYDAVQSAMDVLIQLDQASEGADLYAELYLPYYHKLLACQNEMDVRQATINELQHELDLLDERRIEIQSDLNLQNYLGDLYSVFCSYKREDKFSNSNYISDGLDNSQLLQRAKEFWELAKKEITKSSNGNYTITSTLYNLLVMKEFQPIVKYFELGNWIRLRVDGQLYRLRLIGYEINFDDLQTINVTFSTAPKIQNTHTDKDDIINSAQTMATSYSSVQKQAEKGKEANDNINSVLENGLNSGLVQIKNNKHEEVTYGKHGILLREYDDILDDYTDKQCKLTHNVMAYTTDNWKTVSQVIGEHQFTYYNPDTKKFETDIGYGVSSKFVNAGYVYGSQIVGGEIYSDNYSPTEKTGSYIDLRNGEFSFGGDKLYYRNGKFVISDTAIGDALETININAENLHVQAANIEGDFHGKNIYGGYFLIGDKEGAYAEITKDGILSCNGANFTGSITSSYFSANSTVIKYAKDYSEFDLTRAQQIANRKIECTVDDMEKYDMDGDGVITSKDLLRIQKFLLGTESLYSYESSVKINPANSTNILQTQGVSIGLNGIFSKNMNVDNIYLNKVNVVDPEAAENELSSFTGKTGEYAVGDKTIKVVNGIVVNIW